MCRVASDILAVAHCLQISLNLAVRCLPLVGFRGRGKHFFLYLWPCPQLPSCLLTGGNPRDYIPGPVSTTSCLHRLVKNVSVLYFFPWHAGRPMVFSSPCCYHADFRSSWVPVEYGAPICHCQLPPWLFKLLAVLLASVFLLFKPWCPDHY